MALMGGLDAGGAARRGTSAAAAAGAAAAPVGVAAGVVAGVRAPSFRACVAAAKAPESSARMMASALDSSWSEATERVTTPIAFAATSCACALSASDMWHLAPTLSMTPTSTRNSST